MARPPEGRMKNQLLTRAYVVAGVLVLIGVALFARTFSIAVTHGDTWRARGDSLYIDYVNVEAPRGNILAADGSFLATSQQFYEIRMDTRAAGLTDAVFAAGVDSLAGLVYRHVSRRVTADSLARALRAARKAGDRYFLLSKRVDYPTYQQMRAWPLFRRGANGGGFIARRSEVRRRPFGMMAQRTIGYDRDDAPVGLEGRYSESLGGEAGRRPMMRLPGDHWLPVENLADAQPRPGHDVRTTLDVTIQDAVHQELAEAVAKNAAEYGVAIVLETATGAVRAMSSLTRSANGSVAEDYNHAIGTAVEPGSTWKLASVLALLDDGRITPEDTVRVFGGVHRFYDREMSDAHRHGRDSITVREAFEMSSNVGIARLVELGFGNHVNGRKAYVDKIRGFRLDRPTGIEIEGEKHPLVKDPVADSMRTWSGVTLPWMSMGYEVEVTPLQMVSFYNAVANDGRYMKPLLVTSIEEEGRSVAEYAPVALVDAIASPRAIRQAQELLRGVVERGTAKGFRSKLYTFAGKTGTVQYNYSQAAKRKGQDGHQASFIGYFPADKPKYTILVLISRPRAGNIYGSDVALPVWRAIADKIYGADVSLRPALYARQNPRWQPGTLPGRAVGHAGDIEAVFAAVRAPAIGYGEGGMIRLARPDDSLRVSTISLEAGLVPDVRGMGARDAIYLLENAGCRADLSGQGRVLRQSIAPGTRARGQTVRLSLG